MAKKKKVEFMNQMKSNHNKLNQNIADNSILYNLLQHSTVYRNTIDYSTSKLYCSILLNIA